MATVIWSLKGDFSWWCQSGAMVLQYVATWPQSMVAEFQEGAF